MATALKRKVLGALKLDRFRAFGGRRLGAVQVRRWTTGSSNIEWRGLVDPLRPGRYYVRDQAVPGDAPKAFIHVYEPGQCSRDNPASWPAYIAKVGHKWYPAESITEQLMTRIGQAFGVDMARSKLMVGDDQIRFLSRYFLRPDESLVHGAEILGGYLEDAAFVGEVEQERRESEIFTFQVLKHAIGVKFPDQSEEITAAFVKMIGFDAIVGNQDRHLYNWGVIVHAKGRRRPRFSPVYDTARGLFWNKSEEGLGKYLNPDSMSSYVGRGCPLIGWDNHADLNHFELVGRIASSEDVLRGVLLELARDELLAGALRVVDDEFGRLLSDRRRLVVQECLKLRFQRFRAALEGGF